MAGEIQHDKDGNEWRMCGDKEEHALWVPISAAEKEALIARAKAEKVNLALLVANMLRQWMANRELTVDELDGVVAGATLSTTSSSLFDVQKLTYDSSFDSSGLSYRTVQCPW